MKKNLTFLNPRTFSHTQVRVGVDHLQLLTGVLAVLVKLYVAVSPEPLSQFWVLGLIALGHVRHGRHLLTLPVIASVVLALMSFGMSLAISAALINKLVAQHYRDAGWKIRNQDGEIGEYSSRFLAVHELGFKESDLMPTSARLESVR